MESSDDIGGDGKVLGKIGAPIKAHDVVYKAVFQAVILYGR